MDILKKERLEARGWKVGTTSEFLELTPEENALIEIKLAVIRNLKAPQQKLMTQVELAPKIQSSQPLIDRAENGDASVSIELLIRRMLGTGATLPEIGKVIAEAG